MKIAYVIASALAFALVGGGSLEVEAKPRAKRTIKRPKKAPKKAPKKVPEAPTPAPAPTPVQESAPESSPEPAAIPIAETVEPAAAPEPAATTGGDDVNTEITVAVEPPSRVQRIRIAIDDGPVMRRLRYVDDWATDGRTVRDYDLVANAIGVSVVARPVRELPAQVYARGELVVGVSGSQGPDDEVYATRSSELQVGALIGGSLGRVHTALAFAVGQHSFSIADEMSTRGELVPDTRYRYSRLGGAIGVPLGSRVQIVADAGYRMLSTSGDLASESWFPWAAGDGVDASVGVDVRVTGAIHAYVRGSVRRYFFAMNPEPGDALVVGGAIDQYLGLAAGLGFAIH